MTEKAEIRYRCEICGKTSPKPVKCCNQDMSDLFSEGCMACRGCGFH